MFPVHLGRGCGFPGAQPHLHRHMLTSHQPHGVTLRCPWFRVTTGQCLRRWRGGRKICRAEGPLDTTQADSSGLQPRAICQQLPPPQTERHTCTNTQRHTHVLGKQSTLPHRPAPAPSLAQRDPRVLGLGLLPLSLCLAGSSSGCPGLPKVAPIPRKVASKI